MLQEKPSDFTLLLGVFRFGLTCGLISKGEIVAWADRIVTNENEPDYFFIEVSLSGNGDSLATILDQHIISSKGPVPLRVIMGLIYQRLTYQLIDVETAIKLMQGIPFYERLNAFEYMSIYDFEDYNIFYSPDFADLKKDVIKFLSIYEDFNLDNYSQWHEINKQVEEALKEEQAKAYVINESFKEARKKKDAKRKLKKRIVIGVLTVIAFTVIFLDLAWFIKGTIHPRGMWYLNMFCVYSGIRWGYAFWKKRRR